MRSCTFPTDQKWKRGKLGGKRITEQSWSKNTRNHEKVSFVNGFLHWHTKPGRDTTNDSNIVCVFVFSSTLSMSLPLQSLTKNRHRVVVYVDSQWQMDVTLTKGSNRINLQQATENALQAISGITQNKHSNQNNQIVSLWKCRWAKWSLHIPHSTTCRNLIGLYRFLQQPYYYDELHPRWFNRWCTKPVHRPTHSLANGVREKEVLLTRIAPHLRYNFKSDTTSAPVWTVHL
jgi:hypothetical protein